MTDKWIHPFGSLARDDGWDVVVDDSLPGWKHTALKVGALDEGGELILDDAGRESIVLPLQGSFHVSWQEADGSTGEQVLEGRASLWNEITDVLYLGVGARARISGRGRVAVAQAATDDHRPAVYIAKTDVPVTVRGTGRLSREVRNFGMADTVDASRILACEVITPGGNWSSFPAHKHDEDREGVETALEEIYYFEADSLLGADVDRSVPFALFSTRGTEGRELTIDSRVETGDVVLVPHGFHGPLAVPPGVILYQLNVMAGAGERAWRAVNEAGADAINELVAGEGADERLPLTPDLVAAPVHA